MGESEKTPRRSAKKARCAIYTRKSSEEGLQQAFKSLPDLALPSYCWDQGSLRRLFAASALPLAFALVNQSRACSIFWATPWPLA